MSSERQIASCINCGEEREMAAHGLCFKCYRASERAADNPWAAADRHNRAKLRAQKKLRTAVTAILNAVDGVIDLMEEEHVNAIRSVCGHYFAGLASGLPSIPSKSEDAVNSEHEGGVNRSQAAPEDDVNSEDGSAVNCSQPESAASPFDVRRQGISGDAEWLGNGTQLGEANMPLLPDLHYCSRPYPKGGYGIYELGSTVCVQWHPTEVQAMEAITLTVPLSEE